MNVDAAGTGSERPTSDLQFDRAEFSGSSEGPSCAACQVPIGSTYYAAGGKVFCPTCREQWYQRTVEGSGAGRFLRALFLGIPAAAVGSAVYYAITVLTGYELALVSIGIGLVVGGAVRRGSNGRGGWAYQTLAVVLTYCSIASANLPYLFHALREHATDESAAVSTASPGSKTNDAGAVAADAPQRDAMRRTAFSDAGSGPFRLAIALGALFALALAAPFLAGVKNFMGIVIIGIGLYEAWKMNRRANLEMTGPHELAPAASA